MEGEGGGGGAHRAWQHGNACGIEGDPVVDRHEAPRTLVEQFDRVLAVRNVPGTAVGLRVDELPEEAPLVHLARVQRHKLHARDHPLQRAPSLCDGGALSICDVRDGLEQVGEIAAHDGSALVLHNDWWLHDVGLATLLHQRLQKLGGSLPVRHDSLEARR